MVAATVGIVDCSSKVNSISQAQAEIKNEFYDTQKWILAT